jgi:bifunctional non-homologous end joining protein LigD
MPATDSTVVAGVTVTHAHRVLWPATDARAAITKLDLARYVEAAAGRILPHVAGRPLSVIRAPAGVGDTVFFQRHAPARAGAQLDRIEIAGQRPFLAARDGRGLVALVQWGVVELHPWGCAPGDPETPDQITFDLDPGEGVVFAAVIATAVRVRDRLERLGLTPFVKTTGGRGLHVVVPIRTDAPGRVSWDQALAFARTVSEAVRDEDPERMTTTAARTARSGKVFLDYLRNGRMASAVAPWSVRARPGAGLACPLAWGDLDASFDPATLNFGVRAAVLARPDPWADFRRHAASLAPVLTVRG